MAYLRIETRDGVQRVPLDQDVLRIGRLASNDVILPYRQISRAHAEVERAGSVWWISDLDSTNGLQVGGRRVERYPLQPGERVYLAPDIIICLAADDEDFAALATTQMGVAGGASGDEGDGLPDRAGAAPLLLRLGPDGARAPFSLPARSPSQAEAEWSGARADDDDLAWSGGGWGASGSAASWPAPNRPTTPLTDDDVEGDLFRRKRSHAPGRASRESRARRDGFAPGTVMLHICPTCGQRTPANGIMCQFCRSPLAEPCPRCGLSLLPSQPYCQRCQTPNPGATHRGRSSFGR